jgi:hypothetical protein
MHAAKNHLPSSGMLRRVALVRTDVSEERNTSMIRVTGISKLGITLAVTSNRCTLQEIPAVFWDVTPCGSCENRCFGGT